MHYKTGWHRDVLDLHAGLHDKKIVFRYIKGAYE